MTAYSPPPRFPLVIKSGEAAVELTQCPPHTPHLTLAVTYLNMYMVYSVVIVVVVIVVVVVVVVVI